SRHPVSLLVATRSHHALRIHAAGRHHRAARHWAAVGRAGRALRRHLRHGPAEARVHKHRVVIDASAAVGAAASSTDGHAVVLVVGDPVDAIEGAVVILHGIVVVMPEFLQTLFFRRQALVSLGEDVPPGLIAAIAAFAPAGVRLAGATKGQAEDGDRANE